MFKMKGISNKMIVKFFAEKTNDDQKIYILLVFFIPTL